MSEEIYTVGTKIYSVPMLRELGDEELVEFYDLCEGKNGADDNGVWAHTTINIQNAKIVLKERMVTQSQTEMKF